MTIRAYIAGPLFTSGDRRVLEEIDRTCRKFGCHTYLPHRDAGLYTRQQSSSVPFFERDINELKAADVVIAVLNGTDADSGTSWETGYAYAIGKPIVGFISDTRIFCPPQQINPMLFNSLKTLVDSVEELADALRVPFEDKERSL